MKTLNKKQAIKIATMMLQAATFHEAWIDIHPIEIQREGRVNNIDAIAKVIAKMTGGDLVSILTQLKECKGHNAIELRLTEKNIVHLRNKYQTAPVYQDGKGQQYIMFDGVYTQDYCYQVIDVARYVSLTPTGKYRNIDTLRRRIRRNSDTITLDHLEDSGEIDNIDPLKLQHLYH